MLISIQGNSSFKIDLHIHADDKWLVSVSCTAIVIYIEHKDGQTHGQMSEGFH